MTHARLAAVAAVVIALAAGCSSGGSRGTAGRNRAPVRVAYVRTASAGTAGSGATSASGSTSGAASGPSSSDAVADPALALDPVAISAAELRFDTLATVQGDFATPGLAARWDADPAQQVFTFHLRPGVRFTDGVPLDAAAVKVSLDHLAAKVTDSRLALLLAPIAGYGPVHDTGTATDLSGVTVVDPLTVRISLTQPEAWFPRVLGHPGLGIARRSGSTWVGTHRVPTSVVMVGERSFADALAAYRHGQVDAVIVPDDATLDEGLDALRGLERVSALAVGYEALNLRSPMFADARFRQAIVKALDPAALVRAGYGRRAVVAGGPIPAGAPGAVVCGAGCRPDRAGARALVQAAFGGGPVTNVPLDFDDSSVQRAVATEAQRELAAVGIPSALRPHAVADYDAFLTDGEPGLFRFGWVADVPEGAAFLSPAFASGRPENVVGLKDATLDGLLGRAATNSDAAGRASIVQNAARRVLADDVIVPVVQFEHRALVRPGVRGLTFDPFGGVMSEPSRISRG